MEISSIKKLIVVLILLGGAAYFAYVLLIKEPTVPLTVVEPGTEDVTGQEIVILVNKLKSTTIDQSLFSSEAFKRLKDNSTVFVAEPQGRPNPFAAIGSDSGSVNVVQSRATTTKAR